MKIHQTHFTVPEMPWKKEMKIIEAVRKKIGNNVKNQCYLASEAVLWLTGGRESLWQPYCISKKDMPKSELSHWFLKHKETNEILDLTKNQFLFEPPYEKGKPNGMMYHPEGGSKKTKEFIK